ncbi:membrane protein (plasmid) [Pediococcus damnosus]|uniref:Membrane protein n=1 Tax=Pediococcus damnosus TaxID=51663 RepID=A0AAC9FJZ2_9LACO|nr:ABC transporter permease [Pediococcus damnosus]AMV63990.1 membrane protein [Pediococcus damnosus]AMV68398.1 membrane protein [Pediococcus damnosus]
MFDVIRSKRYWLALLLVGAIIGIVSFALIGIRNSVKVKQIPVALVNEDKGALSNKIESKLRKKFNGKDSKIKWVSPQKDGFNDQKYYGAFIIRSGFSKELQQQNESLKAQIISQKLTTLQKKEKLPDSAKSKLLQAKFKSQLLQAKFVTQKPVHPAQIKISINQGMNAQISQLLSQALPKIANALSSRISAQQQSVLSKNKINLSAKSWDLVSTPISVSTHESNKIEKNTVNGTAPMLLVALAWFSALIPSLILWREHTKRSASKFLNATTITSQLITGLVASILSATVAFLFVNVCFNLTIPNPINFIGLMSISIFVFYLIITCVLDWLGFAFYPLLLVVWFLASSVMSYAPEALDPLYRKGIYSWVPMRFSMQTLKNTLYFHNGSSTTMSSLLVLLIIGFVAAILMYSSGYLKHYLFTVRPHRKINN